MQIQIKKQLKIELDQQDIVEAVGDFLVKHGQKVTADELAEINFVKSPKDGLRATLNITEQTGTDTDEVPEPKPVTTPVAQQTETAAVAEEAVTEAPVPTETAVEAEEDVMPSIDEMQALRDAEAAAAALPETAPVAEEEAPVDMRSKLFP